MEAEALRGGVVGVAAGQQRVQHRARPGSAGQQSGVTAASAAAGPAHHFGPGRGEQFRRFQAGSAVGDHPPGAVPAQRLGVGVAEQRGGLPDRVREPVGRVRQPSRRRLRRPGRTALLGRRHGGGRQVGALDEVAAPLERVGGQRHTSSRPVVQRREVDVRARQPAFGRFVRIARGDALPGRRHRPGDGQPVGFGQCLDRVGPFGADHRAPVGEAAPALLQRVRDVAQVRPGPARLAQPRVQPPHGLAQGARRARRQHQQLRAGVGCGPLRRFGGLLEHHVGVGAARSEGADPGPARTCRAWPRPVLGEHGEPAGIQRRVGPAVAAGGGQHAVVQGQYRLDQPGDAGGPVEVADVGFERGQHPGPLGGAGESAVQRGQLDRVAEPGAGGVALDVVQIARVDVGDGERVGHHGALAVDAGGAVSGPARAVVVDRAAQEDRPDVIAVAQRVGHALERHHADAVADHGARGVGVEAAHGAVRRDD